jgi:Zn-dependent membrane protease YugP
MFFIDPTYLIMLAPCLLLSLWASWKVKHAFSKYSEVRTSTGMSGADAAYAMLQAAGLENSVGIERVDGFLSDHYDPRHKVLRLSPQVYDGRSLASVGVACHEVGHAMQDAQKYAPLVLRNMIVPTASIGSNLSYGLIFLGFILHFFPLAILGLVLFAVVVVFQLVNLIPEFNASTRAKQMLGQLGIIRGGSEAQGVAAVLDAAAMTYVAATITAVVTLLYYAMLIFGGRRN